MKLEVALFSATSRVKALEKLKPAAVLHEITDEELDKFTAETLERLGYIKAPEG